ncbi:MAG: SIR2 family protein [Lachnospiraceae bacterium]|nr:SIR2 family protein [Lachnospiraceae bacterium]
MTLNGIVDGFNTTPFLFIGSGISRRYLGLPDWKGLLEHFATQIRDDPFAYQYYVNKASAGRTPLRLPKVASLIEKDFNEEWFSNPSQRHLNKNELEGVTKGGSPFKAEVAAYIKRSFAIKPQYQKEIELLQRISSKSISGVITTNYDTFLEDHFDRYKTYIGQSQLIFSPLQGVAEIYKIHGSVEFPDSMVINEKDYQIFDEREKYLAAKLMTIFMEYPIIFLGYSINDWNIQQIIHSIVNCLDVQQVRKLSDRFIFVEYQPSNSGVTISSYAVMVEEEPLQMTKISLSDFSHLYRTLENKKATMPVRLLRHLKQELYNFIITNNPTATMRVASIDDTRVRDDELVLAIGRASDFGLKGLSGLDVSEWYRNIVLGDLSFSTDELLQYAFPKLLKQNSNKLPVNRLLVSAKGSYPTAEEVALKCTFDQIISKTIRNQRHIVDEYHSVMEIWNLKDVTIEKRTRLVAHLPEEKISVDELETVLKKLFEQNKNILQEETPLVKTNIRRLIMIYDYLKWGKRKEPSD